MTMYTEKDWEKVLRLYVETIDALGKQAAEMEIIKRIGTNRSRVHAHLLRGEEKGYLQRIRKLNGHEILNNNIWVATEKGKRLLTKN